MFLCIVSVSDSRQSQQLRLSTLSSAYIDRPRDQAVRDSVAASLPSNLLLLGAHLTMPDGVETHKTIYFAYGSNLWIDQMNRRCPEHKYIGIGILHDW